MYVPSRKYVWMKGYERVGRELTSSQKRDQERLVAGGLQGSGLGEVGGLWGGRARLTAATSCQCAGALEGGVGPIPALAHPLPGPSLMSSCSWPSASPLPPRTQSRWVSWLLL